MKITNEKLLIMGYKIKYEVTLPSGRGTKTYYVCEGKGVKRQFEHRLVYEAEFGPIPKTWIVHHKDGNGLNNNIDNLQAMSRAEHQWTHGKKIYIDGEVKTLEDIVSEYGYFDKANAVKALKNYLKTNSKLSRFAGKVVTYE